MRICGIIHDVDIYNKVISLKVNNRLSFFYFQNSQMNIFKRYLYKGNVIDLEYDENVVYKRKNREAFLVSYVIRLYSTGKFDNVVYYDKNRLNKSLSKFL